MKNTKRQSVYFIFLFVCTLVMLIGNETVRIIVGVLMLFLIAAGFAQWYFFVDMLEKRLEKQREFSGELEKRYTAKVEDKQSKINSLQSQINPHFLYNTLECIRSEAVYQGCDNISDMAKSLASFFRYSISRKDNIVTISDELNNIQNYIGIQNYRFENKFSFQIEIEGEDRKILSCLIPKMSVQPIVENAIFHGLETKSGECKVTIRVKTTADMIILTISDNGVGMNEAQLTKLRRSLIHTEERKSAESVHGNGIALYNVNQRIKLSFGENYGLNVYSVEGEGTDVELLLPISTEQEAI